MLLTNCCDMVFSRDSMVATWLLRLRNDCWVLWFCCRNDWCILTSIFSRCCCNTSCSMLASNGLPWSLVAALRESCRCTRLVDHSTQLEKATATLVEASPNAASDVFTVDMLEARIAQNSIHFTKARENCWLLQRLIALPTRYVLRVCPTEGTAKVVDQLPRRDRKRQQTGLMQIHRRTQTTAHMKHKS